MATEGAATTMPNAQEKHDVSTPLYVQRAMERNEWMGYVHGTWGGVLSERRPEFAVSWSVRRDLWLVSVGVSGFVKSSQVTR